MNRFLLLVFSCFILLASCTKQDGVTPQNTVKTYDSIERKYLNVPYGNDIRNVMDIYLPAKRNASTPFVLLIHGGGWYEGDKGYFSVIQDSLLGRGIASASMNYRYVSSTVHYKELMADVDAALKYCIGKHDSLNIREGNFAIGGVSAGAHMAMLYGYNYDHEAKIGCILSFCGPSDFTDIAYLDTMHSHSDLRESTQNLAGAPYVKGQPLAPAYQAISPVYFVKDKPLLMVYGDKDELVLYNSQPIPLDNKLSSLNYTHKFITLAGQGHDLGFDNPFIAYRILNEATDWIKNYSN